MKRWLGIGTLLPREVVADVVGEAFQKLEAAQQAHISDLRVLIDKGLEREAELSGMVKLALEHQFYRPMITGKAAENKVQPAIAPEHLQDVATFDENEDIEYANKHDLRTKKLQSELDELIAEQNDKGLHAVEV